MMISILLRLIVAHIVGDYLLQPDKLCKQREEYGWKGYNAIIIHGLIHSALAYIFVADWKCWLLPVCVFIIHSVIDLIKVKCFDNNLSVFVIDQIVHLGSLVCIWAFLFDQNALDLLGKLIALSNHAWAIVIAILLIFEPTSIFLSLFLKKWIPTDLNEQGLPSGGKWIGYLERLLIVIFVVSNNIVGVGFLLAAKSIFRFGELNQPHEVRTTEYVLIGTLSSFTIAIVLSYITFLL